MRLKPERTSIAVENPVRHAERACQFQREMRRPCGHRL
ncbi:hypothetical protein RGUI_3953 [Rhodovulum sp. P5]|nr:hypothetical protein RGUI_3953 [Rhodovulum sp. P5]